jgi:hypothetical protein
MRFRSSPGSFAKSDGLLPVDEVVRSSLAARYSRLARASDEDWWVTSFELVGSVVLLTEVIETKPSPWPASHSSTLAARTCESGTTLRRLGTRFILEVSNPLVLTISSCDIAVVTELMVGAMQSSSGSAMLVLVQDCGVVLMLFEVSGKWQASTKLVKRTVAWRRSRMKAVWEGAADTSHLTWSRLSSSTTKRAANIRLLPSLTGHETFELALTQTQPTNPRRRCTPWP